MPYKSRTESKELLILKSLNTRMNLSEKDRLHYFNLKKGYEGEVEFDSLTEKLQCDCLILNDLLLKFNNTLFQIDTLILTSEIIYLFEVKNFEGDYYYDQERLYKKPKTEVNNPLTQLSKSDSLLRQLLHNLGFKLPINASVVFINPEFTLYQAPLNKPLIFPTQVTRFLNNLNTISSKLDKKHQVLADKLISLHIEDSPYKLLPSYEYCHLKKGIPCAICDSFSIDVTGKTCLCKDCGHEELIESAVMRCVHEFKLLYPNEKITSNRIHEWCKVVDSKKTIKRILDKNLKLVGVHQWAFYK